MYYFKFNCKPHKFTEIESLLIKVKILVKVT